MVGEWIDQNAGLMWLAVAVVLAVAELLSLDFVLIMLAVGAFVAAATAGMGAPPWAAVLVFMGVSIALLALARPPLVNRLHRGPTLTTGFQNLIGHKALVLAAVDERHGRVQIGLEEWSARTDDEGTIAVGETVRVIQIDGATAVVGRTDHERESR